MKLKSGRDIKGKIGKVDKNIDFTIIKDKYDCITDMSFEYYNSKFQFSDFHTKVLQDKDWIIKKPFLLELKDGYYEQDKKGLELAYRHLVSIYQDLDVNLQRLQDGYHDSMFIRFAFKAGIFQSIKHWEMLMRNWYLGWSMAMRRYYNACHHKYDPTSGISYVAYFDLHFSQYLYYAIGRADQTWQEPFTTVDFATNEFVRLDQYSDNSQYCFEELIVEDLTDSPQFLSFDQLDQHLISFQPILAKQ